jgi:hypothetical protein
VLVLYGCVPQQALLLPRFERTPLQQIWVDVLYGVVPQQALLLPRFASVPLQQIWVEELYGGIRNRRCCCRGLIAAGEEDGTCSAQKSYSPGGSFPSRRR